MLGLFRFVIAKDLNNLLPSGWNYRGEARYLSITDLFSKGVPATLNSGGYPTFTQNEKNRYLQLLMANTLNQQFYSTREDLLLESIECHRFVAATNPTWMAKALIHARTEGYMRPQSILGLAILSELEDKSPFYTAFDKVIRIPSDLQDFYTILQGLGRGHGGRAIKKTTARWLQRLTPYWAMKYNGRGRGFSLGDIVRIVRPKPSSDELDQIFFWLVYGETPEEGLPDALSHYEAAKSADTPNSRVQHIAQGRLPHEVVTGTFSMDPTLWAILVPSMPVLALLRHLATLERNEVIDEHKGFITMRLSDPDIISKAKLYPTQYLKAWQAVRTPWVRDVLEEAATLSLHDLDPIPGKTAVFLDVSGSMGQHMALAALFAYALQHAAESSVLITFGSESRVITPSSRSLFQEVTSFQAFGWTNMESPIQMLIDMGWAPDNLVVITDEQQTAGRGFYQTMTSYRGVHSPRMKTVILDVAGEKGAIAPPDDPLTWWVYGWSNSIPGYVRQIITSGITQLDAVDRVSLEG